MADFVCGANANDVHLGGVNWGRDLPDPEVRDLRNVVEGDPDPTGSGTLKIVRGIEVGHIFQLGTTYSEALNASVTDEGGRPKTLLMGCYGIGVTRVAAAAIEQNHDDKGIIWPAAIAPFEVVISPIHAAKSEPVREVAEQLYRELKEAGLDVLFDDRPLRPGQMFADMELIGIPHRFVVSDKLLAEDQFEYKGRRDADATLVSRTDAVTHLRERMSA
jgi:prolyl-tRNA synthetase